MLWKRPMPSFLKASEWRESDLFWPYCFSTEKNVYWNRFMLSFLSCPKLAFFDFIGECRGVVETVENDLFERVGKRTCLISRSQKCQFSKYGFDLINNRVLQSHVWHNNILNIDSVAGTCSFWLCHSCRFRFNLFTALCVRNPRPFISTVSVYFRVPLFWSFVVKNEQQRSEMSCLTYEDFK